jgi:hypothetical protein
LAEWLGVKASTLNARFRRRRAAVLTVGRTNYVSSDLARELVRLHEAALAGWPTLQEASKITGVKALTLKARCEKGKLACSLDLTKRLRVDPAEFEKLPAPRSGPARSERPANGASGRGGQSLRPTTIHLESIRPPGQYPRSRMNGALNGSRPLALMPQKPAPAEIRVLRAADYGLAETKPVRLPANGRPTSNGCKAVSGGSLVYDPENPFSVAHCRVGKQIEYEGYQGTILKVLDDPFSPRIQVRFPHHPHPLMQEVMLSVGRVMCPAK